MVYFVGNKELDMGKRIHLELEDGAVTLVYSNNGEWYNQTRYILPRDGRRLSDAIYGAYACGADCDPSTLAVATRLRSI